jgi:galactose mutarotase-like enzyme
MNDLNVLKLENEWFSLSVLPEVGAKILTLYDKAGQRQILWENPRIRPQIYPIDANFDNYWCGGWDDAYPTADACVHAGEPFPNLGELRSLEWQVEDYSALETTLSAYGPISPIYVTKSIWLTGQVLHMSFAVKNLSPIVLDFMWGTHPAFAIEAGTRLIIPAGIGIVSQSSDASLGSPGDEYNWPHINGTDMSVVPDFSAGTNCGHYATDLEDGWFAVETKGKGVLYEFPVETCPCLWMWLVYGGWRGYYHAVIEPWTGYPVNLSQAFQEGRHSQLEPGETFDVTVRCTAYQAPETHLDALKRLRSTT